ncbi:hypothetical protein DV738_g3734, partial [Chaetothyriales sp. CBS 135597]
MCSPSLVLNYDHLRFILNLLKPESPEDDDAVANLFLKLEEAEDDSDELRYDRCLMEVIDTAILACKGTMNSLAAAAPTSDSNLADTSSTERRIWKRQIEQAITWLHERGIVWGDVKPENVLIDTAADAWLVDFSGSWTDGWVDEELAETVEGDLQGLLRLKEFLDMRPRWLWNEPQKVQQHTLRFDVKALKHVVAKTAGLEGQSQRVKVKKLAEGASNKVMTATVGQRRFIVKMPDPLVPRRLITASEVATLEFLRTELDLPVPRVLAWSDSDDNAVGREYIILEEARGVDLKTAWPSLDIRQRMDLVEQIVTIQQRLLQASKSFRAYGSLYFTEDAAKFDFDRQIEVETAKSSRYIIGPLAHEHFMDAG